MTEKEFSNFWIDMNSQQAMLQEGLAEISKTETQGMQRMQRQNAGTVPRF